LLFVAFSASNGNDLDRVGAGVQLETLYRVVELTPARPGLTLVFK
jgi:hypothetical protein